MKQDELSVNTLSGMAAQSGPISVSSADGSIRGFQQKLDTVRDSVKEQGLKGSCTHAGWGD